MIFEETNRDWQSHLMRQFNHIFELSLATDLSHLFILKICYIALHCIALALIVRLQKDI